jgi:hypothetical protein
VRSADDPKGYLAAIATALREGEYHALLPAHEQAWLFAAGPSSPPADAPLAVADIESFDRIRPKGSVVFGGKCGTEPGAQLAAATVQGRFHRPDRDAGQLGDLPVAEALHVGQVHHEPVSGP